MPGTVWCLHGHPGQHSAVHSILSTKREITSEHMPFAPCVHLSVHTINDFVGVQMAPRVVVCVEGVGQNAMFYGNMLCMFYGEFVQVQTLPGF